MMAKDWNMMAQGFDPRPSNCVSYNNGNYTVTLSLTDGTMIRYSEDDTLVPSFPDSMDIKITNCCSLNCRYCHEKSTKDGQHGDILSDSFIDKLALKQLDVKNLVPQDKWDMFYMGDEGSSTMYVDMVNREFAANSTSETRYPLLDNVEDMLKVIHQEKKGKDID